MVEYFELKSLCRFLSSIHSKMDCFMCEEPGVRGVRKYTIKQMNKDVMLCEKHNDLFGDGVEEAFSEGDGPVL